MEENASIYIAGHNGLVGSALVRRLNAAGYTNIITRTHAELDLLDQGATADFFAETRPEYVILAAARVGGIMANNTYRADFLYENLQIQNNVIHSSYRCGVKKLLFLGSSCIYPKKAPQPMPEDCLLTSELEYTNEPYAIAKIAGLKLCESYNLQYGTNYIAVMPTNLYGPGDNYDLEKSHVLPALLRKIHLGQCLRRHDLEAVRRDVKQNPIERIGASHSDEDILHVLAKYGIRRNGNNVEIDLWGTGAPRREFLHSDDMADACLYIMQRIDFSDVRGTGPDVRNTHINIGTGNDIRIKDLAELVRGIVAYDGQLVWNDDKPDGTMQKLQDVSKLHALGWRESICLEDGIRRVYEQYRDYSSL